MNDHDVLQVVCLGDLKLLLLKSEGKLIRILRNKFKLRFRAVEAKLANVDRPRRSLVDVEDRAAPEPEHPGVARLFNRDAVGDLNDIPLNHELQVLGDRDAKRFVVLAYIFRRKPLAVLVIDLSE